MECNRLIKAILKNNNINCTQNGILSFNDVLEASKKDNINFKEMCEENGFNFEMIANRQ